MTKKPVEVVFEKISHSAVIPTKGSEGAAGFDLSSSEDLVILPGETRLVHTGLKIAIPAGYEGQVRSRSGLALNKEVVVANSPGTIDSDYRGEVGVILVNNSKVRFKINLGDRIAQLVIAQVPNVEFVSGSVDSTERGEGGFGSTGVETHVAAGAVRVANSR